MRLIRSKIIKPFTYVALIMCLSVLLSVLWLENTSNDVFYDGPIMFTKSSPGIQTSKQNKYMADRQLNAQLRTFDCEKLFHGDKAEMKRATKYLTDNQNAHNVTHIEDNEFRILAMNCDEYKNSRGYFTSPVSIQEKEFPIAFNILFYRNVEQLERLLRVVYRPQNQYCIHIDRKTPERVKETVEMLVNCFDNVFIASKLEIVIYASYTRLTADINCMRDHVKRNYDWKYLLNMAASELPVMTNRQIVQILQEFKGANDIHEVFTTLNQDRFKKKHFTYIDPIAKTGHMIHTNQAKEDTPHGLTITKGNAYNIFSRPFVEFVLIDKKARDLLAWSADTHTPDEHYWATLNNLYSNPYLNTPGGFNGHPDKKPFFGRYIGWNTSRHLERCKAGHYVHNICVFSVRDLPMLQHRHEVIANKFDIEYDPIVYMCMEDWIRNKTLSQESIPNATKYRKIAAKF